MQLFYTPSSPYARIVRAALLATGLDALVTKHEVTLRDPTSALLPYNPVGRVPTLQLDNGVVLSESLLILAHLETLHTGRKLLPMDGSDGWTCLARLGTAMGLLDGIAVWNRELRRPEDERSPTVTALETTRCGRTLDALNASIADPGWHGPLDASHIALMAALDYCERRHPAARWREGRAELVNWFDLMWERSGFAMMGSSDS